MFITLKSFAIPQRGGALVLAAACFPAGLTAGALTAPVGASRGVEALAPGWVQREPATVVQAEPLRSGHPAEVVRVLDGDTFEALVLILNEGTVGISRIGQDKYGGRVDADVSTATIFDASVTLLEGGFARRYFGGRRANWCG